MDDRTHLDKSALLSTALANAGFVNTPVAGLVTIKLHTRRRVDLECLRAGAGILLGLHRVRSHEIVDMTQCALLEPQLLALLPPLRILLRSLEALRRAGSVMINLLDNGPDILLRLDANVTGPDKAKLIAFARAQNVVRISVAKGDAQEELVAVLSAPVITLSGIQVTPPPGAFLQPSQEGEAEIIKAVLAGLPKLPGKMLIAELYAGIGSLSFTLVRHARVQAYEGDAAAVAALEQALRQANLAGRIQVAQRDLMRRPLLVAEMAKCNVVVLDPPYAGAGAQMRNLASSSVKRIIYVSCNPEALARDATVLKSAGYQVLAATPIDQFPYSENIEAVVVFEKAK